MGVGRLLAELQQGAFENLLSSLGGEVARLRMEAVVSGEAGQGQVVEGLEQPGLGSGLHGRTLSSWRACW